MGAAVAAKVIIFVALKVTASRNDSEVLASSDRLNYSAGEFSESSLRDSGRENLGDFHVLLLLLLRRGSVLGSVAGTEPEVATAKIRRNSGGGHIRDLS